MTPVGRLWIAHSALTFAACAEPQDDPRFDPCAEAPTAPRTPYVPAPAALCGAAPTVDAATLGVVGVATTVVALALEAYLSFGPESASPACALSGSPLRHAVVRYVMRATAHLSVRGHAACPPHIVRASDCALLGVEVTRDPVPVGTELRLVLAHNVPLAVGRLSVTEVERPLARGALCVAYPSVCSADTRCGFDGASFRCLADGAPGGRCRSSGAPCDLGLWCSGGSGFGDGTCVRSRTAGESCDGSLSACASGCGCGKVDGVDRCMRLGRGGAPCHPNAPHCDPGLSCSLQGDVWRCGREIPATCSGGWFVPARPCALGWTCETGNDSGGRCVFVGAGLGEGRPCGAGTPPCVPGLACIPTTLGIRCARSVPRGTRCDNAAPLSCGASGRCLADGPDAMTCAPVGTSGGPCRVLSAARCDDGLLCMTSSPIEGSTCVAAPRPGEPCAAWDTGCAGRATCVPQRGGVPRCVAPGAENAACRVRPGEVPCDAGLSCVADRCVQAAGEGASPCTNPPCAPGLRCAGSCRRAGLDGGFCRVTSPRCDAGLVCVEEGVEPVCVASSRIGAVCSPSSPRSCPTSATCAPVDGGGLRCVASTP